jgi:hypothetical protein
MASVVLTDVHVSAGSDISVYVLGIDLQYESVSVVETSMGQGTEVNKHAIFKWGGTITFKNDYADNLVDEIVFALIGTTATFTGRPVKSTVVGPGNPNYTGTAKFDGYAPLSGNHGELAKATLKFSSAGPLSRATA